jgi:hypothetical protein
MRRWREAHPLRGGRSVTPGAEGHVQVGGAHTGAGGRAAKIKKETLGLGASQRPWRFCGPGHLGTPGRPSADPVHARACSEVAGACRRLPTNDDK